MTKKILATVGAVLLLSSITSWTAEEDCSGNSCTLRQLIVTCKQLENNGQIKDFRSEVHCGGTRFYWQEMAMPGNFQLEQRMIVSNEITMKSNRYHVPQQNFTENAEPYQGECRRYEEIRSTIPTMQVTLETCAELEELETEGRGAFCQRVIEESGIPAEETQPTGRTHSLCNGGGPGPTPTPTATPTQEPVPSKIEVTNGQVTYRGRRYLGAFVREAGGPGEPFYDAGGRNRDLIISVNQNSVQDKIDFDRIYLPLFEQGVDMEFTVYRESENGFVSLSE